MSGWGIAETAPVIEKIKAESADYLRGLNSCGVIAWDVYDKAFDFYMELISRAYEEGKNNAEPHWIPCSERLPEEKDAGILKKLGTSKKSEYVLATVDVKGERMTVTACTHDGKWDWNMKYAFPDFKVVAWMPLPEPYKDGEHDE